jgi:hypothetical protein
MRLKGLDLLNRLSVMTVIDGRLTGSSNKMWHLLPFPTELFFLCCWLGCLVLSSSKLHPLPLSIFLPILIVESRILICRGQERWPILIFTDTPLSSSHSGFALGEILLAKMIELGHE